MATKKTTTELSSTTAKRRCKAGDLAFITNPGTLVQNMGKVVKVLAPTPEAVKRDHGVCSPSWTIESQGQPILGNHWDGSVHSQMTWDILDRCLTPIHDERGAETAVVAKARTKRTKRGQVQLVPMAEGDKTSEVQHG
jgi:hypothetical protein